ncbi:glutamine amidotransferase [Caballeronia sp. LjRoot31]|uniref:glutamine amidotransferase n=1 Tax=Caballeronia sp. LjRoot31 TaxID=3342324 RepID=UPI003ED12331
MKTVAVFRHVLFEDLGTLRGVLEERGYEIRYFDMGVDDPRRAEIEEADLMVVLGGPIGVFDDDLYPFLRTELAVISERLLSGRPILGICLGAQLMARALGARVTPMEHKEIAFGCVSLSPEGRASALGHLGDDVPVLHWHGDEFQMPEGCHVLASTAQCKNQAFQYGACALALQFHLEADVARIEQWLIGHSVELMQNDVSMTALRESALRSGAALGKAASQVFNAWVNSVPGLTERPDG